jgi:hypothetical protein
MTLQELRKGAIFETVRDGNSRDHHWHSLGAHQ